MPNPKGNPTTLEHYKPSWKSGRTQTIRVPVALAKKILDYAHQIDDDSLSQVNENTDGKSAIAIQNNNLVETLLQVLQVLEQICETPHTSKFTKALKTKLQFEVIERLKQVTQVNNDA